MLPVAWCLLVSLAGLPTQASETSLDAFVWPQPGSSVCEYTLWRAPIPSADADRALLHAQELAPEHAEWPGFSSELYKLDSLERICVSEDRFLVETKGTRREGEVFTSLAFTFAGDAQQAWEQRRWGEAPAPIQRTSVVGVEGAYRDALRQQHRVSAQVRDVLDACPPSKRKRQRGAFEYGLKGPALRKLVEGWQARGLGLPNEATPLATALRGKLWDREGLVLEHVWLDKRGKPIVTQKIGIDSDGNLIRIREELHLYGSRRLAAYEDAIYVEHGTCEPPSGPTLSAGEEVRDLRFGSELVYEVEADGSVPDDSTLKQRAADSRDAR